MTTRTHISKKTARKVRREFLANITLRDIGTPWAEMNADSHTLTGYLASEPVYCQDGEVSPLWQNVGRMTEREFAAMHEAQIHNEFHSSHHSDWSCPLCQRAGWTN